MRTFEETFYNLNEGEIGGSTPANRGECARPAKREGSFTMRTGLLDGKRQGAIKWTRLCRTLRPTPWLRAPPLGSPLATGPIKDWSLTSLKGKLIKIGGRW